MVSLEQLKPEYEELFSNCTVLPERMAEVDLIIDRVLQNESRYRALQARTSVPWSIIGVIHHLESSLSFEKHFHNGDPLTAKTVNVPPGRPPGNPPFSWEDSAQDALQHEGFTGWQDWSISGSLYKLERNNGFGYRNRGINSPYLWSFSTHYTKGKFVSDGIYDPNVVSQQCGAGTLLKAMQKRGVDLNLNLETMAGHGSASDTDAASPVYPGRIVRIGDDDRAVVQPIQLRLNTLGCGPLQGTGFFGNKTEAAVRLFQARFLDCQGQPLVIDGEVGSLSWAALFGCSEPSTPLPASDLLIKVLSIAASQVGVRESPLGSNNGPEVKEYLASVGLSPGNAWCVAFEYWCFEKAAEELGRSSPMIKTGGVLDHWRRAGQRNIPRVTTQQAQDNPSLVKPGMLFTIDTGGGFGHSGIVIEVHEGKLTTIEGNTNDDGSREGIGVFRRQGRKIASINVGFIDYAGF